MIFNDDLCDLCNKSLRTVRIGRTFRSHNYHKQCYKNICDVIGMTRKFPSDDILKIINLRSRIHDQLQLYDPIHSNLGLSKDDHIHLKNVINNIDRYLFLFSVNLIRNLDDSDKSEFASLKSTVYGYFL